LVFRLVSIKIFRVLVISGRTCYNRLGPDRARCDYLQGSFW